MHRLIRKLWWHVSRDQSISNIAEGPRVGNLHSTFTISQTFSSYLKNVNKKVRILLYLRDKNNSIRHAYITETDKNSHIFAEPNLHRVD